MPVPPPTIGEQIDVYLAKQPDLTASAKAIAAALEDEYGTTPKHTKSELSRLEGTSFRRIKRGVYQLLSRAGTSPLQQSSEVSVPAYTIHGGQLLGTGQLAPAPRSATPGNDWLAIYLGAMDWAYFSMLEPPVTLRELAAAKRFTDGPYICDMGQGIQWLFIMGVGPGRFRHIKAGRDFSLSDDDIANLHILAVPEEFVEPRP